LPEQEKGKSKGFALSPAISWKKRERGGNAACVSQPHLARLIASVSTSFFPIKILSDSFVIKEV